MSKRSGWNWVENNGHLKNSQHRGANGVNTGLNQSSGLEAKPMSEGNAAHLWAIVQRMWRKGAQRSRTDILTSFQHLQGGGGSPASPRVQLPCSAHAVLWGLRFPVSVQTPACQLKWRISSVFECVVCLNCDSLTCLTCPRFILVTPLMILINPEWYLAGAGRMNALVSCLLLCY